jgi:hypothetical protein
MARRVIRLGVCAALLLLSLPVRAQVPPPGKPTPPSAPPAPPAQSPIEGAVRETLQQYAVAMESLDADQVKKVYPSVDVEGLRRALRDMRELKVSIDSVKVLSVEGTLARVSFRVVQAATPKAGRKESSTVTRVFRFRKQEAVWLIDGYER